MSQDAVYAMGHAEASAEVKESSKPGAVPPHVRESAHAFPGETVFFALPARPGQLKLEGNDLQHPHLMSEVCAVTVQGFHCSHEQLPPLSWHLESVGPEDRVAEHIWADVVAESVVVTDDHTGRTELLAGSFELGEDQIYAHHVGEEQDHVLPVMVDRVSPQVVTGR